MPSASSPDVPVSKTFSELRQRVESAYLAGKREADDAAIRSAWLIGQLIERHVMLFQERADYGAKTIRRGGFLNNALLENGHAVRMNPSAPENWIP